MVAKVSIIVPVCNSEKYLKECLDSILSQSIRGIEVVCVNDGSTDNSANILDRYACEDSRMVVISQKNSGYGKAMNVGISAARGEWICFVESDDYILPSMYSDLVSIAERNRLDFVKSSLCRFFGEGEKRTFQREPITKNQDLLATVVNPSKDPRLLDALMNNVTGVYRKEFLDNNQIRFNETPGASFQDNGFWFQTFMKAEKAMLVDEAYYMVRRDNPNSSVKSAEKVYCMREEYQFIFSLLESDEELFNRFIYQWCKKLFSNCVATLNRIDRSFRRDFLCTMSQDYRLFKEKGWIDFALYNQRERRMLTLIMDDPERYCVQYVEDKVSDMQKIVRENECRIEQKTKKLNSLKHSQSLKIGHLILHVPQKLHLVVKDQA